MKGFYIEITNNLLDPKHRQNIGESVWLFMWLIDHVTSTTEDGRGIVLGGKPVKYEEVKVDLGISQDTYSRWITRLEKYPYIETTRAPRGLIFKVLKSCKRFGEKVGTKRGKTCAQPKSDSALVRSRYRNNAESIYNDIDNTKTIYKFSYQGMPARRDNFTKEWKILDHGQWCKFAGKESEIKRVKK